MKNPKIKYKIFQRVFILSKNLRKIEKKFEVSYEMELILIAIS